MREAVGSAEISTLIQALRKESGDLYYIRIPEDIYNTSTTTIVIFKKTSKVSERKYLTQGDAIHTTVFKTCLEDVLRSWNCEHVDINVNGEYVSKLRFADDIVLLSNLADELQSVIADYTGYVEW